MSVTHGLLLLRARARVARRRIVEHAFVLFALGPLVLGALAWVAQRYLSGLGEPLLAVLARPGVGGAVDGLARPSLVLAAGVALVLWPGSLRSLFGHGDDPVDAWPVTEGTRLAVAWVESTARAFVPALVLAAAASVLATGGVDLVVAARRLPTLWLATAVIATLDMVLVSIAVHRGRATLGSLVGAGLVAALLIAQPWPAARVVLAPLGVAGTLLRSALAGDPVAAAEWLAALSVGVGGLVMAALLVPRWRRRDLERARAADAPRQGRGLSLAVLDRLPAPLAALLRRDLRLVFRRFSPAVHLAIGTSVVAFAVTVGLASDPSFSAAVRRGGLVLGSAVAVLAVVSIVPFLLRHQLAASWLERSAGVELEAIWRTKVALTAALAVLPTAIGIALALLVGPADPWLRAATVGQVLLAAFAVASIVGTAAFEMAEEPLLSLVFTGFTGLAVAVLYVAYPQAWWLWLAGHLYLVGVLAGHGPRRVRFTEVER